MGATPFRHIDFVNHEPITKEKMDQYQSNVQWLVDHTPVTLHVNEAGQASISNLIIVGGRATVPFSRGWGYTRIYFGGAFDPASRPVVTSGVCSDAIKQPWVNVSGIDNEIFPDSRGFDMAVQSNEVDINGWVHMYWMAIGKRSADYERF